MHDSSQLSTFIALRANGRSLAGIALEIGVPKSTLWEWDTKHQHQINRLKQIQLEKFQNRFLPTYEEELSRLAAHLNRLEEALEEKHYNAMSPACLLQMALQVRSRLARMRQGASVHKAQPNELSPAGCITRNAYEQFNDEDLVVDSAPNASDSENQNRTKPDEIAGGVENRSLSSNDLQQVPKSARPVLHSQTETRQSQ